MQYFLVFLEGVASFVSPCMLPMLPIYVAYFSAQGSGKGKTLRNASGFILGFTVVFMLMGAAAGSFGRLLTTCKTAVNIVCGILMILLGAIYIGLLPVPIARWLQGAKFSPKRLKQLDFLSALLFGVVFSVGWTPCIGVFLSAALLMAASAGHAAAGVLMLLCYSLGLGLPFLLAAILLEQLKDAVGFLKRHMGAVNLISGCLLVVVGIAMATGSLDKLLGMLL